MIGQPTSNDGGLSQGHLGQMEKNQVDTNNRRLFLDDSEEAYQIQVKVIDSRNYTYESFDRESKETKASLKKEKQYDTLSSSDIAAMKGSAGGDDDDGAELEKGSCESYVRVQHGRAFFKTELIKNDNPIFNEYFIFTVTEKELQMPILFSVMVPQKIRKAKEMGSGCVFLKNMHPNVPKQEWVHFVKRKHQVSCQVRVEVVVKPKKSRFIIQMKVPRLLLVLEKTKYMAGELVRGAVVVNVGEKLTFKYLRIDFKGEQKLKKDTNVMAGETVTGALATNLVELGNENISKMVAKKNIEEVVCRFAIFHTYADVLKYRNAQNEKAVKQLDPGQHVFPFCFVSPFDIPPTREPKPDISQKKEHKYSNPIRKEDDPEQWSFANVYRVKAEMGGISGYKTSHEHGLVETMKAAKFIEYFVDYAEVVRNLRAGHVEKPQKDSEVMFTVITDDLYFVGTRPLVEVYVENNSKHSIHDVQLYLVKHIEYNDNRLTTVRKKIKTKTKVITMPILQPGSKIASMTTFAQKMRIEIPDGLDPSMPKYLSPSVHLYYTILVEAVTKKKMGLDTTYKFSYHNVCVGRPLAPYMAQIKFPKKTTLEYEPLSIFGFHDYTTKFNPLGIFQNLLEFPKLRLSRIDILQEGNKLCKHGYTLPDMGRRYDAYFYNLEFVRLENEWPSTDELKCAKTLPHCIWSAGAQDLKPFVICAPTPIEYWELYNGNPFKSKMVPDINKEQDWMIIIAHGLIAGTAIVIGQVIEEAINDSCPIPGLLDGVASACGRFATNVIIGLGDVAMEGYCQGRWDPETGLFIPIDQFESKKSRYLKQISGVVAREGLDLAVGLAIGAALAPVGVATQGVGGVAGALTGVAVDAFDGVVGDTVENVATKIAEKGIHMVEKRKVDHELIEQERNQVVTKEEQGHLNMATAAHVLAKSDGGPPTGGGPSRPTNSSPLERVPSLRPSSPSPLGRPTGGTLRPANSGTLGRPSAPAPNLMRTNSNPISDNSSMASSASDGMALTTASSTTSPLNASVGSSSSLSSSASIQSLNRPGTALSSQYSSQQSLQSYQSMHMRQKMQREEQREQAFLWIQLDRRIKGQSHGLDTTQARIQDGSPDGGILTYRLPREFLPQDLISQQKFYTTRNWYYMSPVINTSVDALITLGPMTGLKMQDEFIASKEKKNKRQFFSMNMRVRTENETCFRPLAQYWLCEMKNSFTGENIMDWFEKPQKCEKFKNEMRAKLSQIEHARAYPVLKAPIAPIPMRHSFEELDRAGPFPYSYIMVNTVLGDGSASTRDGVGLNSAFLKPQMGIKMDSRGNVYLATNNEIRKLTHRANGWNMEHVVGLGLQQGHENGIVATDELPFVCTAFSNPFGIAINRNDEVFISDVVNRRIRKLTDKYLSDFWGPGGPFMDGKNSYDNPDGIASEKDTEQLHKKDNENMPWTGPQGMCFDTNGDLLFCDSMNHKIKKVNRAGHNISVVAGTGLNHTGKPGYKDGPCNKARFHGPRDLCLDHEGNIIVTEFTGHRVRKIIVKENRVVTIAGSTGKKEMAGHVDGPNEITLLNGPSGVCMWGQDIIVTCVGSHCVKRISESRGFTYTMAGPRPPPVEPLTTSKSKKKDKKKGSSSLSSSGSQRSIPPTPGCRDGCGREALFDHPVGICAVGPGSFMVVDSGNGNHRIRLLTMVIGEEPAMDLNPLASHQLVRSGSVHPNQIGGNSHPSLVYSSSNSSPLAPVRSGSVPMVPQHPHQAMPQPNPYGTLPYPQPISSSPNSAASSSSQLGPFPGHSHSAQGSPMASSSGFAPSPAPEKLPYPWEAFVDSNGRTYYVNHETKSSQWVRPDLAPQSAPLQAPQSQSTPQVQIHQPQQPSPDLSPSGSQSTLNRSSSSRGSSSRAFITPPAKTSSDRDASPKLGGSRGSASRPDLGSSNPTASDATLSEPQSPTLNRLSSGKKPLPPPKQRTPTPTPPNELATPLSQAQEIAKTPSDSSPSPTPHSSPLQSTTSQSMASSSASLPKLPSPWEAMQDPNGRTYYVNHETKSSQWTMPELGPALNKPLVPHSAPFGQQVAPQSGYMAQSQSQTSLPSPSPMQSSQSLPQLSYPWEAMKDQTGRTYYVNHVTKSSQWTLPENAMVQPAQYNSNPTSPMQSPQGPQKPLAYPWEAMKDQTGRTYYVNHVTKSSQWTYPV